MYLRLLVSATYLCIAASFLQRGHFGHNVAIGRRLKVAQDSDPDSTESIFEQIISAPQRISDSTQRIAENIQATPKKISDSTQRIADKILSTPDEISKSVEQVARNVKEVTDAVIYFPSNVTATVTETQTNIKVQAEDIKNSIKALSPLPFINRALAVTKNVIDTAYELKDGKINGVDAFTKLLPAEKVKVVKPKTDKKPEEVYEEIKESFYITLDNINGFGRGVVETADKVVATAERVQKLPEDISKSKESLTLTAEILQKDFAEKQQQADDIGKVIWKVVTLEAAKETFERTEKKYQDTVKYVTDTKTMLQTNPTAIFSGGVKEKKVPVVAAPAPVIPKKKDDSALGKIWEAIKVTKSGLDVTVSAVQSASNGVKGLKERIDKSIAEQELSDRKYGKQPVVSSISSTPFVGDALGELDSSEGVSSSSTKVKSAIQTAAVVVMEAAIEVTEMVPDIGADVSSISEPSPEESPKVENNSDLVSSNPDISTPDMPKSRPLY
jgi:hypothetical protein